MDDDKARQQLRTQGGSRHSTRLPNVPSTPPHGQYRAPSPTVGFGGTVLARIPPPPSSEDRPFITGAVHSRLLYSPEAKPPPSAMSMKRSNLRSRSGEEMTPREEKEYVIFHSPTLGVKLRRAVRTPKPMDDPEKLRAAIYGKTQPRKRLDENETEKRCRSMTKTILNEGKNPFLKIIETPRELTPEIKRTFSKGRRDLIPLEKDHLQDYQEDAMRRFSRHSSVLYDLSANRLSMTLGSTDDVEAQMGNSGHSPSSVQHKFRVAMSMLKMVNLTKNMFRPQKRAPIVLNLPESRDVKGLMEANLRKIVAERQSPLSFPAERYYNIAKALKTQEDKEQDELQRQLDSKFIRFSERLTQHEYRVLIREFNRHAVDDVLVLKSIPKGGWTLAGHNIDSALARKLDKDRSGALDFSEVLRHFYPSMTYSDLVKSIAQYEGLDPKPKDGYSNFNLDRLPPDRVNEYAQLYETLVTQIRDEDDEKGVPAEDRIGFGLINFDAFKSVMSGTGYMTVEELEIMYRTHARELPRGSGRYVMDFEGFATIVHCDEEDEE